MPHSVPSFRIIQIIQLVPPNCRITNHRTSKESPFPPMFCCFINLYNPHFTVSHHLKMSSEFPLSIFVPYIFLKKTCFFRCSHEKSQFPPKLRPRCQQCLRHPQHPPFLQVLAARSQRCDEAQDAQLPGVSGCWVVIGYEGYESKAWHTKNP